MHILQSGVIAVSVGSYTEIPGFYLETDNAHSFRNPFHAPNLLICPPSHSFVTYF